VDSLMVAHREKYASTYLQLAACRFTYTEPYGTQPSQPAG